MPALCRQSLNGTPNGPKPSEDLSFEILEVRVGRKEPEPALGSDGDANHAPVGLNDETI